MWSKSIKHLLLRVRNCWARSSFASLEPVVLTTLAIALPPSILDYLACQESSLPTCLLQSGGVSLPGLSRTSIVDRLSSVTFLSKPQCSLDNTSDIALLVSTPIPR